MTTVSQGAPKLPWNYVEVVVMGKDPACDQLVKVEIYSARRGRSFGTLHASPSTVARARRIQDRMIADPSYLSTRKEP
jgi:hypothetical protein